MKLSIFANLVTNEFIEVTNPKQTHLFLTFFDVRVFVLTKTLSDFIIKGK